MNTENKQIISNRIMNNRHPNKEITSIRGKSGVKTLSQTGTHLFQHNIQKNIQAPKIIDKMKIFRIIK